MNFKEMKEVSAQFEEMIIEDVENYDGLSARAVSKEAIGYAKDYIIRNIAMEKPDVSSTQDGSVVLMWMGENRHIILKVFSEDGSIITGDSNQESF